MPAEDPGISRLREGRFLKRLLHIEAVLFDLLIVYLVEKLLDLRRVKAGLAKIEITVLNILQKFSKKVLVPRTRDLVQCDVQCLLTNL